LLAFIPLSGRGADFIETPLLPLVYLIASGIIAMAIGDSIYIKSLSVLDASIAFPIAQCSFPVLTVLLAVFLLGESFTWVTGAGAVLVVLGIYLIAAAGKRAKIPSLQEAVSGKGVIFALMAAAAWTAAAAMLKIGVTGIDAFVAAGIRISVSAIVLSFFALRRRKKGTLQFRQYGPRSLILAAGAGILAYGVGRCWLRDGDAIDWSRQDGTLDSNRASLFSAFLNPYSQGEADALYHSRYFRVCWWDMPGCRVRHL
jgi:drug/metabolite transporter (DMT)-like permease